MVVLMSLDKVYLQDSVKLLFNHWKSTNLFFMRCVDTSQVNKSAVLMTLITYYTINDTFFSTKERLNFICLFSV